MIKGGILFKKNYEGIYLRCLDKPEANKVLTKLHDKFGTTHGSHLATTHAILRARYYWPTIFKDTVEHIKCCHTCQIATNRERYVVQPLQLVMEMHPFAQWGMDFIGPINPPSSLGHMYVLTITDYYTRWTKVVNSKTCTTKDVIKFLERNIVTRYGVPYALVCDNGPDFVSLKLSSWAFDYGIILKFSSNYYPLGNGLAESTNKNLLNIIKKLIEKNPREWNTLLKYALCMDQTRMKIAMGNPLTS